MLSEFRLKGPSPGHFHSVSQGQSLGSCVLQEASVTPRFWHIREKTKGLRPGRAVRLKEAYPQRAGRGPWSQIKTLEFGILMSPLQEAGVHYECSREAFPELAES